MRRTLLAVLALSAACARISWEGNQTLARDVPAVADTLLIAAAEALRAHGYDARIIDNTTIITAPKEVPQYQRPVSTAADTVPSSWVIHVTVEQNTMRAGSRLAVTGFLVPRDSERMVTDTAVMRSSLPVTSRQPQLLSEVERIGNWIVEAAQAKRNP
jgi:hypothetical protein